MADPVASKIEAAARRAGVDAGTLAALVAEGAGLTAAQRERVRREHGIDPKVSDDNQIDAVALELARAQKAVGNPELAVAAFRADSTDPAAWDRPARAFARRVSRRTAAGIQMQAPAGQRTGGGASVAPVTPTEVATVEAEAERQAAAEQAPPGEAEAMPQQGASFGQAPEGAPVAAAKWVQAYRDGTMSPADRAEFEADVRNGALRLPEGVTLAPQAPAAPAQAPMGVVDTIKDVFTGESRRTATTEAATDVTLSPQMMEARRRVTLGLPLENRPVRPPGLSLADQMKFELTSGLGYEVKSALMQGANAMTGGLVGAARLAALESAPQREQMQILAANTPGMQVVTDEKGNQSFVGPDGVTYSERPGLRVTDAPRIPASVAPALVPGAMAARGGMAALGGAMATQAGIQAVQETAQAEMGGEFNPADVALAGAAEGVAPLARGIKGALRPAAEAATEVAPAAAKAADAGVPLVESQQLGKDIRAAAGGDAEALARVASLAAVDKEAAKAAEDLGIDLPLNVLADGPQVREGFDAVISKLSGPERAAFKESEVALAKRADEVLASFDAAFSDGRVAPGEVSKKVADAMAATRDQVEAKAKALYRQVDEVVPNESIAKMDAVRLQIMKRAEQVGNEGLSAPERAILEKIKEGDTPLGLIRQEKNLIGQAVGRLDAASPYASMEKGAMKALYAALAADEAANVARIGGEEAARMLKKAHGFTKVQKGLEERAVAAFGKLQDGDLSPLMKRALTNAVSDDNKALRQLMEIVPDANKREVLATAIAGLGRDTGGRFSPAKFADAYPGLWKNKVARELIREHLGQEADKMLGALAAVSKRVAYANKRIPKTGESLQELARMDAQGLLSKVMSTGLGRFAAVGTVGAIPGIGNALATLMAVAPSRGKGATLEAMSALLRDDAFAKLAIDMASGAAKPADIKRMARSARLRAFLKAAKEPADPASAEKWLTAGARGAMLGGDREPVAKEPKL